MKASWQNLALAYRKMGDLTAAIATWDSIAKHFIPDSLAAKATLPAQPLEGLFTSLNGSGDTQTLARSNATGESANTPE